MFKKIIIFLMLVLTGCAVKMPVVSTYVLSTPTAITTSSPTKTNQVLLVSAMTADSAYKTDRMIYVYPPADLHEYTRHAWAAPPAQMLLPIIIARLEAKNYFRAVVTPPFYGKSDYRLDTRLVVLQQEFVQSTSQVRCIVQAVLINNTTSRVIASRRFQAIVGAGNNPESGVAAANQAAQQISNQISQFTVSHTH